jgi:23S rRNA pseudouridine1911/1915/1917 synthase
MAKENLASAAADYGKRLDLFLAERLKEKFSRSQLKRLIEDKKVLVDNKIKKASYKLTGKEEIEIILPETQGSEIVPEDIPLDIVYEDDDILVVNKPAGIVVHPAEGNPEHTLVNALLFHTKGKLSHIDTSTRPGIVHRLDKEVSGLMVVAKTDFAHKVLVEGFKAKAIKRRYIAFVDGVILEDTGRRELPIGRAKQDRKKMAVRFTNSKEAATRFRVLKRFPRYTKLELELETGRTHQIRVHMSYMGHPIIGDTKYGGTKYKTIALYAAELTLQHPRTDQNLHFKIDIPQELKPLDK